MKELTAIGLVGVLLLAGCAESKPSPAAETKSYRTVEELKDEFIRAGGDCPEWAQTNQVKLAAESGTCGSSNVLSTYTSEAEKDHALALFREIAQPGTTLLVGPTWIINDKSVKELSPSLGGTVVSF